MKNNLLYMLGKASRDRPLTRQEIMSEFHVVDRVARGYIEELRDMGYPVCGTSEQQGYWLAQTHEELMSFLKNYTKKARTIQRRAINMKLSFLQERWVDENTDV